MEEKDYGLIAIAGIAGFLTGFFLPIKILGMGKQAVIFNATTGGLVGLFSSYVYVKWFK